MRDEIVFIPLESQGLPGSVHDQHRCQLLAAVESGCVRCDFVDDVRWAEWLRRQIVSHSLFHLLEEHVIEYEKAFVLSYSCLDGQKWSDQVGA